MTSDVTASDAAASDVATNDGTAGDVTVGDVSTGEARGSRGANGRRPRPAAANFDIAALSRTAGRAANEDYADFLQAGAAGCWVIADGLGGHRGGATASKTVVQAALDSFRRQPEITIDAVSAHIARAQEALLEAQRQEPSLSQMRSTIVVLLADESEAVWAHVGDSRLYHLRGGKIVARTRDHSVGQALVDGGQIDPAAQGSHEDRSRLLRCLGKADEASAAISGPHRLARGDVFLLCTDGFWEALDDVSLSIDLAASADAAAWLDRLEARLRRRIGAEHDNYTATAIRILNEAIPPPPPHDPRAPAFDALPPSAAMGPTGVVGVRGVTAVTGVTGVTGVGQHETMAITLRDRVPRAAIVAAIALVAVLAAAGVWKRAAISAWVRALMPPAGAVAPTEGTPKKAPIESETKPDAMPKTTPDTKPVTKPQARPDAESDPASDDKPDVTPDAATSSSALSRPRGGHQSAAAASTNAQGAKKAKSQRDATARDGAKNQDDAKNQQNVKKRDASAPDPPPSHSAPIARPRPPAPPPSTPPREEVR
jgi:serine/threonine protein phosphatase PrpC